MLYRAVQYCIAIYYVVHCCTIPSQAILDYTAVRPTVLYCDVLHDPVLCNALPSCKLPLYILLRYVMRDLVVRHCFDTNTGALFCYAMLCRIVFHRAVLCPCRRTIFRVRIMYCITLCCADAMLHDKMLYHMVGYRCCIMPFYSASCCIILCCVALCLAMFYSNLPRHGRLYHAMVRWHCTKTLCAVLMLHHIALLECTPTWYFMLWQAALHVASVY